MDGPTRDAPGGTEIFTVHDRPVMGIVSDVIDRLNRLERLTLTGKDRAIPTAVAVANIVTEKVMKDSSRIEDVRVDSEDTKMMGRMLSIIEITLSKTSTPSPDP